MAIRVLLSVIAGLVVSFVACSTAPEVPQRAPTKSASISRPALVEHILVDLDRDFLLSMDGQAVGTEDLVFAPVVVNGTHSALIVASPAAAATIGRLLKAYMEGDECLHSTEVDTGI